MLKTAKHFTPQTTPYNSPRLWFSGANDFGVTPTGAP